MLVPIDPRVRVRIGTDRTTGRSRGFAFAEFSEPDKAQQAIRQLDGFELRGRRLRVNDADDKPPPRAPRPGVAQNGGMPSVPKVPFEVPQFAEPIDGGFNRKGGSRRGLRARKRSLRYS